MEFIEFKKILQDHVKNMIEGKTSLFVMDTNTDVLWNLYLDSFPPGSNKIFRVRREYDCSCCRHFIRDFGNVAVIENNEIISIWDIPINDDIYTPVVTKLSEYVKSKRIRNKFITKTNIFGTSKTREMKDTTVITWDHFCVVLPIKFISRSPDINSIISETVNTKNVFKRSLEEINNESVLTVLELISQNSLYRGKEWEKILIEFLKIKNEYNEINDENKKDIFCWNQSTKTSGAVAKIKNHSIGTLLLDITDNIDLDIAVSKYEKIVAPTNYKRPKPIFTEKMVNQLKEELTEMGFIESLGRRYAKISDISINNVLFANRNITEKKSGDIFADLQKETSGITTKTFKTVEEIPIEKFIKDVLPKINNMEILFEGRHIKNLVSLIAPVNKDSKTMFKWNNNYSWAYKGNITDSMKERVKAAGGKVDGKLRFSIQWNEEGDNKNDFDAHCIEPSGERIYYGHKKSIKSLGQLDVDIIHPKGIAVENITWNNEDRMLEGKYIFGVHNFTHRGGQSGFRAEIEYDGQIYSYDYNKMLKQDEFVTVAELTFNKKSGITFIKSLPNLMTKKQIWNITTGEFIPVNSFMLSPNYWDEQCGIGNKHYMFMLKDCINDESPNGFFNEFLINDLSKYRKVLEALGGKLSVEDSENQLSGLGFSDTKRDSIICKVSGNFKRIVKIVF